MRLAITIMVGAWLCLLPGMAAGAPPGEFTSSLIAGEADKQSLPQQLIVDLEKKLWTAYQGQAQDPFVHSLEKLNLQYSVAVEKQVAASERSAVKLAVRNELELLESGESPLGPGGRPKPSPVEEIRFLRATYADQYHKLILQRAETTRTLLRVFVQELEKLQRQLELAEAKGEVAIVAELRERLPKDNGERGLEDILKGADTGRDHPVEGAGKAAAAALAPAAAGLPKSVRELERYLKHTVWKVKVANKDQAAGEFRFRGDGWMAMPWHSVRWRPLDGRSVMMDNGDWQFKLVFSEDMRSLTARGSAGRGKDGWDGEFSRRITSVAAGGELERIVGSRKWRLAASDGKRAAVEFGPKLVKVEGMELPWKKWDLLDGILVISDSKKVVSEFFLASEERPYQLEGLTSKQGAWRLIEVE